MHTASFTLSCKYFIDYKKIISQNELYQDMESNNKRHTWKVDWITYTFGYILHRSCWPSFVWTCCTIKSMATWFSPPRGMITSAYFFDGNTKLSKAGFTNLAYCKATYVTTSLKRLNLREMHSQISAKSRAWEPWKSRTILEWIYSCFNLNELITNPGFWS